MSCEYVLVIDTPMWVLLIGVSEAESVKVEGIVEFVGTGVAGKAVMVPAPTKMADAAIFIVLPRILDQGSRRAEIKIIYYLQQKKDCSVSNLL